MNEFDCTYNHLNIPNKISMILQNKKWFTLVELVVVIVILGTLSALAFVSFQQYPINTRNAVRDSDLTSINTAMEVYFTDKGEFPQPDNSSIINYSGATLWEQGTIGTIAYDEIAPNSQLPVDPLYWNEYTYSIIKNKKEFLVATMQESWPTWMAKLIGNYNGRFVKTNSGSNDYIIATPSIVTGDKGDITIDEIISNQSLVFYNYSNPPSSYKDTYSTSWYFPFTPSPLLLFHWNTDDLNSQSERWILANNLQSAYWWSTIIWTEKYDNLINATSTGALIIVTKSIARKDGGLQVPWVNNSTVNTLIQNQ